MSQRMEEFAVRVEQAIASQAEELHQAQSEGVTSSTRNGEVAIRVTDGEVTVSLQTGLAELGKETVEAVLAEAIQGLLEHYSPVGVDDSELTGLSDELEQQVADLQTELARGLFALKTRAESTMPTLQESPTHR